MNLGIIRINRTGTTVLVLLSILILYYVVTSQTTYPIEEKTVDLKKMLIAGIQVAIAGGHRIVDIYNSSQLKTRSKGTKNGVNMVLTDADIASHCEMYYGLAHLFPSVEILSEEITEEKSCRPLENLDLEPKLLKTSVHQQFVPTSDITVWIDPLDATQEFTEHLIQYVTTMVCVAVKGVPILGIVHFPFTGETTWGWVGQQQPTQIHKQTEPLKFIVSRSHKGRVEELIRRAMGHEVAIIAAGGAGYKLLEVTSGNASVYMHITTISKWDICAGHAILRARGGNLTTMRGKNIDYSSGSGSSHKGSLLATLDSSIHQSVMDNFIQQGIFFPDD